MGLFPGGLFVEVGAAFAAVDQVRMDDVAAAAMIRFAANQSGTPIEIVEADAARHRALVRDLAICRSGWANLAALYCKSATLLPTEH